MAAENRASRYQGLVRFLDREAVAGYVFASPFIIGFLAFTILPMLYSFYISFTSYRIASAPTWIGISNYVRMFTRDPRFLKSIGVTLYYVVVSVPLKGFALFAALLTRNAWPRSTVRFITAIVIGKGGVAGGKSCLLKGVVNSVLSALGLGGNVSWFETDVRYSSGAPRSVAVRLVDDHYSLPDQQIPETRTRQQIDGGSTLQQFSTSLCLPVTIIFQPIMQTISAFMNSPLYNHEGRSDGQHSVLRLCPVSECVQLFPRWAMQAR